MEVWYRAGLVALILFGTVLVPRAMASSMSSALMDVYARRPDLQASFDATGTAIVGSAAGFLMNLEDWARQYGWSEYPELVEYRPRVLPPMARHLPIPEVNAEAWVVVDATSGTVLGAHRAGVTWPIASITKLMTVDLALQRLTNTIQWFPVMNADDVGGAKLFVQNNTRFRIIDLMYAALVGSANNAANAVSRTIGISPEAFVALMNERADAFGLSQTVFVDPSGIELGNVSTPREVAYMTQHLFSNNDTLRRMTQTYRRSFLDSSGEPRIVKTTNWMIFDPAYDDVWVMGGKTGFLYESGWNVVEVLRPNELDANREIVVVVFGSPSRPESFNNAKRLADWAWDGFTWTR